jgi:membrane protein DedA with SNARE-associated domain
MTNFVTDHGLPLLFLVVMIESFGIPLPGETALIAFGVLASEGHYSIASVIAVAAAGAIVGDNLGYWLIGRVGGRALFARWHWLSQYSDRVLPRTESLMARYGGATVFFGRFVAILRYTVAWVAGLSRMPWWRFLFWNAAGAVCWATAVGLLRRQGRGRCDRALRALRRNRHRGRDRHRLARRSLRAHASREATLNLR